MSKASSPNSSRNQGILLEFTRELVRHSSSGEVYNLKSVLQKDSIQRERMLEMKKKLTSETMEKSLVSSRQPSRNFERGFAKSEVDVRKGIFPGKKPRVIEYINPLVMPKTQLPPRFQYLKPTPTKLEIDLGKLNPFVKDPLVGEIECSGANQKITVIGTMGRRNTNVSLTREEIEEVINKFSEVSKIPVQEGVFKVVAGNYVFSAIVSNLITSRFVIKKINYNPAFRR